MRRAYPRTRVKADDDDDSLSLDGATVMTVGDRQSNPNLQDAPKTFHLHFVELCKFIINKNAYCFYCK